MSEFQRAKQALRNLEFKLGLTVEKLQDMEDSTSTRKLTDDEHMEYSSFQWILDKLQDVLYEIEYLNKPIVAEGTLYKNEADRYEMNDNYYFTSGSPIEIYIHDSYEERNVWHKSRVEHNGDDYYVVGYKGSIDGLRARVRT